MVMSSTTLVKSINLICLYCEYRPAAGYTGDLSITSDKNHWTDERLPGWYGKLIMHKTNNVINDIVNWCRYAFPPSTWSIKTSLPDLAHTSCYDVYFQNEKEYIMFSLRWL